MDLYKYSLLTIPFLVFFQPTLSQFPRRCTDDDSLRLRECCPVGPDGSKCGKSSNRGICTDIRPYLPELSKEEVIWDELIIITNQICFLILKLKSGFVEPLLYAMIIEIVLLCLFY